MKSSYDIDLINELHNEIINGDVKIHDESQIYFDELENNYPVGFNGIDWSNKKHIYFQDLKGLNSEDKKMKIFTFLNLIIDSYPEFKKELVVVIGDGSINLGYEMCFTKFIELNTFFFDLPQHTYVVFLKQKKCINFTFEDELFFG